MIPWPPDSPLNTPLSACPSLGPESLETLAKKSIFTRLDLLLVPPLFYRDRRLVVSLADAEDQNDIVFIGRVISSRQGVAASGRAWLKIDVVDGDDLAHLWFFHNIEYLSRLASVGQTLLISGQIYLDNRGWPSLDHPEICLAEKAMDNFLGVKPIYRAYPGIPPTVLKRVIAETLSDIPSAPKVLPAEWLKRGNLLDPVDLLAIIHAPPPNPGILPAPTSSRAYHRLATFELMFWRLLILAEKSRRDSKTAPREPEVDPLAGEKFLSLLPFKLTPEQIRVSEEFTADLRSAKPLNRLLQGEVGSGKTVVAGLVASVILARGKQVAFLAPTEFLARRYFEFLSPLMEKLGRVPALLIGSLSLKEKRRVLKGLSDGAINLAIGDQTLLPAIRSRADLGLAIIDERERFGVRQRLALTREYPGLDLMSLSAPIPRSLAPILYGDMDISSIHDPSHGSSHNSSQGQKTPETIVYQEYDSAKAYEKFFAAVRRGQPGVALCPRLGYDAPLDDPGLDPLAPEPAREEDAREEEDLLFQLAMPKEIKPRPGLDILAIEKLIRAKAPDLRLGVIHGRQEPALRHKTLKAFEAGRLDILAATSIIEVGVDTPSANITLVEGADIFGLSKLHQLRSQVGRGGGQGLFLAISSYKATDIAGERLEALTRYADGFKLAEMDMKIRGPGEEVELKASGWPIFKFAKFPRDLAFWPKALELADNLWPRLGQWPDLAARIDLLAKELASWPETKTS